MSCLDRSHNLLHTRIVYWGPASSGKTTTLAGLHRVVDPEGKYRLYRIVDRDGGTAFFDMLPMEEYTYGPHRIRTRLFAVPGTENLRDVRRAILKDADAIIVVGDSSLDAAERNRQSVEELDELLIELERDPAGVPRIYCVNRQDLLDVESPEALSEQLQAGDATLFGTVATDGAGVFDAFREAFRVMLHSVAAHHGFDGQELTEPAPEKMLPQLARRGLLITDAARRRDEPELVITVDPVSTPEAAQAIEAQIQLAEAHVEIDAKNHVLVGRNRELMAVNRVARSILSAMEAENLLVVLLDTTAEHLGATHASCVLFDSARSGTLRTHVLGFGRDPILDLSPEDAHSFFLLMENSDGPIAAQEKHHHDLLAAVQKVDVRVRHSVYQPIKDNAGRPAGWIGIYALGDEAPLSTQSLLFLSSISRLAALGLDKIRLLSKVQEARARQEQEVLRRTGELEMANAKIRALNRGLEARVAERTRALEEANTKLREARAQSVQVARLGGMGHVAASFAHEVNNPVAGLNANLSFMQEALDELRERLASGANGNALGALAEFEEIISESRQSVERVTTIISTLKRLGGEEGVPVTFNLNSAVADAVTLLEERVRSVGDIELQLGSIPEQNGEVLELSHAVLAIITNAVEALERKRRGRGRITITTFEAGGQVTLSVRDTGDGIDPSILDRVFEPFVSTKEGEHNAGLGLHAAYRAARRQGGEIRIRNRTGEGVVVTMVLPVQAPRRAEEPARTGQAE
jgi:signal transduction histidine kinase/signal recognition particle receptor subunit beta